MNNSLAVCLMSSLEIVSMIFFSSMTFHKTSGCGGDMTKQICKTVRSVLKAKPTIQFEKALFCGRKELQKSLQIVHRAFSNFVKMPNWA